MTILEGALLWAAMACYVMALVACLAGSLFGLARIEAVTRRWWPIALGLHFAAGIVRWIATGHAPVMRSYENSLSGSFFVGLIFLLVSVRFPVAGKALPGTLALQILILGNGMMAPATAGPLEPPFKSAWLAVHVLFAWLAFGSYLVASVLAGLYLRAGGGQAPALQAGGGQAPALLDDVGGRLIAFGSVADTVMIASGAIWAHGLWGRYWGWDPVETWSLVSWLTYGVNLHLRFALGWKGRRAAWLAIASAATVVVTFFGIGVVSDVHTELLR